MQSLAALFAPVVLLLPLPLAEDTARPIAVDEEAQFAVPQSDSAQKKGEAEPVLVWPAVDDPHVLPIQYQVRIEQRLIIRVSPRRPVTRENLNAEAPRQRPRKLVERKMGKCVKMNGIAGVQPTRDNRLMLYMRDQRIIAANLEKACSARDFYSGFYVEPSKDGNLCIARDNLQSRTGAKCKVSRLRQMVPEQI